MIEEITKKYGGINMDHTINIKRENGHFIVYVNRKFFCSADSFNEAIRELNEAGYI